MKKKMILVCCLSLLVGAVPAKADLFGFSISGVDMSYSGSTLSTTNAVSSTTIGYAAPAIGDVALALFGTHGGSFAYSMNISNITATTADGAGSFTFADTTGDTVTGNMLGTWSKSGSSLTFSGVMQNVLWNNTSTDGLFDGGIGAVDMGFASPQPWNGGVTQITGTSTGWFTDAAFRAPGGSLDAVVVPVPGAVLLGVLGLGAVGVKLRKFA